MKNRWGCWIGGWPPGAGVLVWSHPTIGFQARNEQWEACRLDAGQQPTEICVRVSFDWQLQHARSFKAALQIIFFSV
jgi:hypothetical protein